MWLTTYQWTTKSREGEPILLQSRTARDSFPREGGILRMNAYVLQKSGPSTPVTPSFYFRMTKIQKEQEERIITLVLTSNHQEAEVAEVLERVYFWQRLVPSPRLF
jgi:hypothetical protein